MKKLTAVLIVFLLSTLALAKPYAYVSIWNGGNGDGHGNTVQVIDTGTNRVVATITVGAGPGGLAVTSDGSRVYVGNNDGTVSVINTATNTVIATIPVTGGGAGVGAINPNGQYVYVSGWYANTVYVISVATNNVVATIPMPNRAGGPEGMAISPDGTRLFVAALVVPGVYNAGGVVVVDTMVNQVVQSISLPDGVAAMAIAPNDSAIYVGALNLNEVLKISTITYKILATIPVGSRPINIVITPNGRAAYVADSALFSGTPDVEEIKLSTNQVIASIPVGTDPVGLALNPNGSKLYVTNQLSSTVSVIDTLDNSLIATIPVQTSPTGIAIRPFVNLQCQ